MAAEIEAQDFLEAFFFLGGGEPPTQKFGTAPPPPRKKQHAFNCPHLLPPFPLNFIKSSRNLFSRQETLRRQNPR